MTTTNSKPADHRGGHVLARRRGRPRTPRRVRASSVGRREIGHLHGDHAAHFSFPRAVGARARRAARAHPVFPADRWPRGPDRDEADIDDVIALMRINYERVVALEAQRPYFSRPLAPRSPRSSRLRLRRPPGSGVMGDAGPGAAPAPARLGVPFRVQAVAPAGAPMRVLGEVLDVGQQRGVVEVAAAVRRAAPGASGRPPPCSGSATPYSRAVCERDAEVLVVQVDRGSRA